MPQESKVGTLTAAGLRAHPLGRIFECDQAGISPQGEELTLDYGQETESEKEQRAAVCLCGADACRGSFLTYASHAAGAAQPQQQVSADVTQPGCMSMWQRSSGCHIRLASCTCLCCFGKQSGKSTHKYALTTTCSTSQLVCALT